MAKVKVVKIKMRYRFGWEGKEVGFISAYSEDQARRLWKRGYGRHIYPGLCQVASIVDRVQIEDLGPVPVKKSPIPTAVLF